PAVAGRAEVVLRRQPASGQGPADAAEAADGSVGPVQPARHHPAGSRHAAERTGQRVWWFARIAARRTVGRLSECRFARAAFACVGRGAGHGPAARPGNHVDAVAGARNAATAPHALNCTFGSSCRPFLRKARKSAPILLSFSVSVTAMVTPTT